MTEETQYERPNTVSGLKAKHKELSVLREKYKAEIKKLTVDIDHLDAAIRLFDPDADVYRIKNYAASWSRLTNNGDRPDAGIENQESRQVQPGACGD